MLTMPVNFLPLTLLDSLMLSSERVLPMFQAIGLFKVSLAACYMDPPSSTFNAAFCCLLHGQYAIEYLPIISIP